MSVVERLRSMDLAGEVRQAGSATALAARLGCSPSLVQRELRDQRRGRGEAVEDRRVDWNLRLRYQPTAAQVRSLLASHGAEAVRERWGAPPNQVLDRAAR